MTPEDYDGEGRRLVDPFLGLAPQNVGLNLTREIRVVGDRLLIRLATNAADGTPITRTLTFGRLA